MSEIQGQSPLQKRMERRENARKKGTAYRNYINESSSGLEVGLSIVAGSLLGYFFDEKFGTQPWGFLVGLLFGVGAATRVLIEIVRKNEKRHGDASAEDS